RGERLVELLAADDERRSEPYHRLVSVLGKHAIGEQALGERARGHDGRIDLDAGQEALAANLADEGTLDRPQLPEEIAAQVRRTPGEIAFDEDGERFEADRGRERISGKRAAVVARTEHLHHLAPREKGRDGIETAAERLAEDQAVGHDAVVLAGEHPARAP